MPDSETFDAFYARTVWNVTSHMHELAGDDGLADHAIREAYAKAYQQWYQVSGYSDSEGWVLGIAKDAYERRRAETPGLGQSAAAEAGDSGTWPGFFRPAAQPGSSVGAQGEPPADPDGTLAPPRRHGPGMGDGLGMEGTGAGAPGAVGAPSSYWAADGMAAGGMAAGGIAGSQAAADDVWTRGRAYGPSGWYGPAAGTEPSTRGLGPDGLGGYGLGGSRGVSRPGRNGLGGGGPGRNGLGSGRPNQLAARRNLIVAGVAVAVLAIAGITYASLGGHKAPAPAASQGGGANPAGKPDQHMLAAGQTGQRSAIPWSLVGPGWALAEFSTAAPSSAGQAPGSGGYTTYLVDPEGGKYKITTSSSTGPEPQLMAWSGDGKNALFATTGGAPGGTGSYQLLHVRTGQLTSLQLPAGVVAAGFTRPDGLRILAVSEGPHDFRLQRYKLGGQFDASLASLRRKGGEAWPANGCAIGCALSSPNGDYDVWGIAGAEMRVLSNAGGKATRLRVQDSGHPPSCIPVTWWNESTILADCAVTNMPDDASRLWLVPSDGSKPTALTSAAPAGYGRIEGAWLAGQTTYATSVISRQCASAPYGLRIMRLGQGSGTALTIPGSTSSTVVGSAAGRLLVLAQSSCQGGSSLLWFDPSAGTTRSVLAANPSQAGVIAAVPYGNGPTALSSGQ